MSIKDWLRKKLYPEGVAAMAHRKAYFEAMVENQKRICDEADELNRKFGKAGYWQHKAGLSFYQTVIQLQNERSIKTLYLPKP